MSTAENTAPQTKPSIMTRLRAETQLAHDTIEQTTPVTELIKGNGTKKDYINVLKSALSYYRPFEQRVKESGQKDIIAFMQDRFKTALIEKDLEKLGVTGKEIAAIPDYTIPSINSPEEMLGALYVLEGSTMGGKVITKELKDHFNWALSGEHFLDPYGSAVRARWEAYGAFTEQQTSDKELNRDAMVQSAQATFIAYNRCLADNAHLRAAKPETEAGESAPNSATPKRRLWGFKKSLALITVGTLGSAAVGGIVGAAGGGAGTAWVREHFSKNDTSSNQPTPNKDDDILQDALIGAAVFGLYGLKDTIILSLALQGISSGWRRFRKKDADPKCPLGFDRIGRQ
jgi:heme oxygenase